MPSEEHEQRQDDNHGEPGSLDQTEIHKRTKSLGAFDVVFGFSTDESCEKEPGGAAKLSRLSRAIEAALRGLRPSGR